MTENSLSLRTLKQLLVLTEQWYLISLFYEQCQSFQ